MVDETDIRQEKQRYYETRAKAVINYLQKRQMRGQYAPGLSEALAAVMAMIPPGAAVARGDSVSVDQVGIFEAIKKRGQNRIINPLERDGKGDFVYDTPERRRLEREAFSADIFLSSANAITLDGKLVSIDGHGNRVAPMIFGPDKVIFIVGANKIVKDVDEALARIHNIATPINSRRHALKHNMAEARDLPCVKLGYCVDCKTPERPCRYTVIIEGSSFMDKGRFDVVVVGEELGI
ncbi:MAG: hypothetical protein A2Z15_05790 [Chloroflexi bacterium RBG_16_50_11]|nr:MAG: hypothetical protein A2Z15_05790 [Chloroflexi bacterium RBG_16_50_11]